MPLVPGDHGVGSIVPDLAFADLGGREHRVGGRDSPRRLTVFVATSTSCPASRRYLPTLAALAEKADERVRFVLVDPIATDEPEAMRSAAERIGSRGIYVHDPEGTLARGLNLLTTTDVIVIDAARTVLYHGAVDDQYGVGYSNAAPTRRLLADALAALLAGAEPATAATDAPGCDLDLAPRAPAPGTPAGGAAPAVTWHGRIARIVERHCVECHRDGGTGPFPLRSRDDVVAHAGMIRRVVADGIMPPWFAAEPAAGQASPWANDRSLSAAEKRDLLDWLAGERPAGDPADAPLPREFSADWAIGVPDAVFAFPQPVAVKAEGTMPYQHVVVETGLAEDRWVTALEVRPGSREVVHHVLVQLQSADGRRGDERDGFWAEYVPGQNVLEYPAGFAKRLPRGSRLVFQMHYTPNGTATTDLTRLAVKFAVEPPRHEVKVASVSRREIAIPPHAVDHREDASIVLPFDATVLGFLPHMHLRGKACRYELARGGGPAITLLDIPRYDFNWQLLYRYREPLPLRAGDTLRFTAWYDNSAGNPANPDPTRTVRWGPQTFEEMHLGYVEYFVPAAEPGTSPPREAPRPPRPGAPGFDVEATFRRLDHDGDGRLVRDEWPRRHVGLLERLDADKDGVVTLREAKAGLDPRR